MEKIRLLIVEDESIVAKDIENMTRGLNYEVCGIVANAEAAVLRAEIEKPDLVLMDIVLRGNIDGIKAAELIWSRLNIPVVYITAYADKNTLNRAKLTEPFGYILKPFNERELQTVVEMAYYKSKIDTRLREREAWLSAILQNIGDGVIATDHAGRISFMNPVAEKLTGWSLNEARLKQLEDVFSFKNRGTAEGEGLLHTDEILLIARNGTRFPVEHARTPISDGQVLVFRDISERVKAEKEVREGWSRLKEALEGTIQAFAMTIEIRDPYTAGHQRRVAHLAEAIAREMQLGTDVAEGLRVMGNIHDIGKIYVPAEILSKPGQISSIEYVIIQSHPQVGYDILQNIHFPWPVAQVVLQHHERLDGTGYPNGLKGKDILLEARILSVADVVEAMSSHRPYRPGGSMDLALKEIEQNKNIRYDGPATEACLRLFKEKGFVWE